MRREARTPKDAGQVRRATFKRYLLCVSAGSSSRAKPSGTQPHPGVIHVQQMGGVPETSELANSWHMKPFFGGYVKTKCWWVIKISLAIFWLWIRSGNSCLMTVKSHLAKSFCILKTYFVRDLSQIRGRPSSFLASWPKPKSPNQSLPISLRRFYGGLISSFKWRAGRMSCCRGKKHQSSRIRDWLLNLIALNEHSSGTPDQQKK